MSDPSVAPTRQRLSKSQRHDQLLDVARDLIRAEGTDEFTLARLAERAGVSKPVAYNHFGDRSGVLAELYREFEAHQRMTLARALQDAEPDLATVSRLVARAYIDCCFAEGRELVDVVDALTGSAALIQVRQAAEDAYLAMCSDALEPLTGPLDTAGLRAIIGAGEALARSAIAGAISAERARGTLASVITAVATEPQNESEGPS